MYTEPKSRAKNASVVPMAAPAVATLHAAHAQAAKAVNTDCFSPPFFFIMLPLSPSKKARNTPGFFALQNIFSHVIARRLRRRGNPLSQKAPPLGGELSAAG